MVHSRQPLIYGVSAESVICSGNECCQRRVAASANFTHVATRAEWPSKSQEPFDGGSQWVRRRFPATIPDPGHSAGS
jgi:hypothetical protein